MDDGEAKLAPGDVTGPTVAPLSWYAREPDDLTTPKARRTRARLLDASRTVFERDGFLDARVADIAAQAGVSHGTFYTYFTSKTDVFRVIVAQVMSLIHESGRRQDDGRALTARERIDIGNRRFVEVYREHGTMLTLMESAMAFDPEVRSIRLTARDLSVKRVRDSIARMQADGRVRADLDPALSAAVLVSMVGNFVYFWLGLGQGDWSEEEAVDALTELWTSALHLDSAEG